MLPSKRPDRLKRNSSLKFLLLVAGATIGACSTTMPQASSPMPIGQVTSAPSGLVSLCKRSPEICRSETPNISLFAADEIDAISATGSIRNDYLTADRNSENPLRGRLASLDARIVPSPSETSGEMADRINTKPLIFSDSVLNVLAEIDPSFGAVRHARWTKSTQTADKDLIASQWTSGLNALFEEPASMNASNLQTSSPNFQVVIAGEPNEWHTSELNKLVSSLPSPTPQKPSSKLVRSEYSVDDKAVKPVPATKLVFDQQLFAQIERINRTVNGQIIPRTDAEIYGLNEVWTLPITFRESRFGDCEDYALEKREALKKAGIPASSMYFAVAHSPATGRHALLVISTDKGDYVLDNMTSEIRPWQSTNYTWISRQSSDDPLTWARTQS